MYFAMNKKDWKQVPKHVSDTNQELLKFVRDLRV